MTSLLELAGGRLVDRDALLEAYLRHVEARYEALRSGWFDQGAWWTRQLLTNHRVEVDVGGAVVEGEAAGVDPGTGALLVETEDRGVVPVQSGEVVRCRSGV
jgi:biotin-(acetyl-CoA carboxylase) ligase